MTTAFCTLLTTLLLFAVTARCQSAAGQGSCPGLMNCMQQTSGMGNCSWGAMGVCIAGLEGKCHFKEGSMTLKQVLDKFQDFCRVTSRPGEMDCDALGQCVLNSDFVAKTRTIGNDIPALEAFLLDSNTWCQYLEMVSGCVVTSSSSSNCNVSTSVLTYMTQQHSSLQSTCSGSHHHHDDWGAGW